MKIIDLLNKIANGEEVPNKFKLKDWETDLVFCYNEKYNCYDLIGEKFKNGCYVFGYSELNDEIEILEEEKKIPEKLEEYIHTDSLNYNQCNYMFEKLTNKYNELINYLDYLKSKGD